MSLLQHLNVIDFLSYEVLEIVKTNLSKDALLKLSTKEWSGKYGEKEKACCK